MFWGSPPVLLWFKLSTGGGKTAQTVVFVCVPDVLWSEMRLRCQSSISHAAADVGALVFYLLWSGAGRDVWQHRVLGLFDSCWLLTPHPALLFSCFLVVVVFGVCSCSAGSKIFGTEFYVFRPPPRSTNESHQYHSVLCVFPCGVGVNESQRLLSLSQSQVEIIYFSAKIQRGTKENYLDSTCDFFTLTVAYWQNQFSGWKTQTNIFNLWNCCVQKKILSPVIVSQHKINNENG